MTFGPEDTIPIDAQDPSAPAAADPREDDTEPTPLVPQAINRLRPSTVDALNDAFDINTDVESLRTLDVAVAGDTPTPTAAAPMILETPPAATPVPVTPMTPPLAAEPVVGLVKPARGKNASQYAERKFRLPTESEIHAAVESTPTENLPVVKDSPAKE